MFSTQQFYACIISATFSKRAGLNIKKNYQGHYVKPFSFVLVDEKKIMKEHNLVRNQDDATKKSSRKMSRHKTRRP